MIDPVTGAAKRPTLLTVLCILSFVGIGIMVMFGLLGYMSMKMFASGTLQEMVAQTGDAGAEASIEELQAKIEESGLTAGQLASQMLMAIVFSLISLVGVIMMWKLRKMGFYIYAACAVAGIVAPFLMGGKFDSSAGGLFSFAVPLVFLALYYTQTKHMS
ncbi:MAG: hypothetical protein KA791_15295 [Flavobacteriales bacterium]|nr:hypothetical protein [Flavobacteriales bacterium]